MNAKQIQNQTNLKPQANLALVSVEKAKRPSLWSHLKKAVSSPAMNLDDWERLEMKRTRSSFNSNQWRNF